MNRTTNDGEKFKTIALQLAACEAQKGHNLVAAIGRLDMDQVDILRKVNKELLRVFIRRLLSGHL